jgi:hypothetical protein
MPVLKMPIDAGQTMQVSMGNIPQDVLFEILCVTFL